MSDPDSNTPPPSGGDGRVFRRTEVGGGQPRIIEAEVLFGGGREVFIAHRGERYRLSITQGGKLILTK